MITSSERACHEHVSGSKERACISSWLKSCFQGMENLPESGTSCTATRRSKQRAKLARKSQAAILAMPSAQQGKPTSTSALDDNFYKHGMGRGRSLKSLCCTVVLALEVPWASLCETSTCPCWHLNISSCVSVVTSLSC